MTQMQQKQQQQPSVHLNNSSIQTVNSGDVFSLSAFISIVKFFILIIMRQCTVDAVIISGSKILQLWICLRAPEYVCVCFYVLEKQ